MNTRQWQWSPIRHAHYSTIIPLSGIVISEYALNPWSWTVYTHFRYGLQANPVSWPFKSISLASPVAITRTSKLLSYHSAKSQQLTWISITGRCNLKVPNDHMANSYIKVKTNVTDIKLYSASIINALLPSINHKSQFITLSKHIEHREQQWMASPIRHVMQYTMMSLSDKVTTHNTYQSHCYGWCTYISRRHCRLTLFDHLSIE